MVGISYGGISQLFVAATRPPSLAAITPLSVIDNTQTTLYPGGILNTGFALSWAKDRVHDARPASTTGGQAWALKRIKGGDKTCKANQALHAEAVDLLAKIRANDYYVPKVADPLAPITFVHKIKVPTFLACQWTDEQTGGHCPTLADALHRHQAQVVHVHQRRRTSTRSTRRRSTAGTTSSSSTSRAARPQPAGRRAGCRADDLQGGHGRRRRDAARRPDPGPAELRRRAGGVRGAAAGADPVRQRRRRRAGRAGRRASSSRSRASRCRARRARSWYLGPAARWPTPSRRRRGRTRSPGAARARPATDFTGNTGSGANGLWTATPAYDWTQNPAGTAASYVTRAADRRHTVVVGAGALQRVDQVVRARRRPAGHGLRGPARRQGDVRAERLAARRACASSTSGRARRSRRC